MALLCTGCSAAESTTVSTNNSSVNTPKLTADEILVLGDISSSPSKKVTQYQLMVDADAIDNGARIQLPDTVRDSMKIILETESVARHIALVSLRLPEERIDAVKAPLLTMDQSPDGKTVLDSFEGTAKFDDFPVEQSMERLQTLYQQTF